MVGSFITITCDSIAIPTWSKSDNPIPQNVKVIKAFKLYIGDITVAHRGVYECEGTNDIGQSFIAQSTLHLVGK